MSAPRHTVRHHLARVVAGAVVAAAVALPLSSAGAQAANYPSLQLPTASVRDYTAAIASGAGTMAIFQWREGVGAGMHLGLDAGVADYNGRSNLQLLVGGSGGYELLRAAGDQPLDLMLTGGVGTSFGGGSTIFRVPVGVSVGHTFDLEQGMSLTPYVHPRLSLDVCNDCGGSGRNRSEVSLNFDLGVSFQVNRQFAVRVAGSFSGSDFFGEDSFAVGLNWRPSALAMNRQRAR